MAFLEFADILWEATKPTIALTDNKSVTQFFQTEAILWSACEYVLQLNFKIAHIAGSVNTAADFLSRLELKARRRSVSRSGKKYKQHLLKSQPPLQTLQMKNSFSSRKQMIKMKPTSRSYNKKKQFREKAAEWVVNQEPSSMKPSIKEFTKIEGNTTSYSLHGIKASARIRVYQEADLILKNLELKILGQRYDDVLMATDRRF